MAVESGLLLFLGCRYFLEPLFERACRLLQNSSSNAGSHLKLLIATFGDSMSPKVIIRWSQGRKTILLTPIEDHYRTIVKDQCDARIKQLLGKDELSGDDIALVKREWQRQLGAAKELLGVKSLQYIKPVLKAALLDPILPKLLSAFKASLYNDACNGGAASDVVWLIKERAILLPALETAFEEAILAKLHSRLQHVSHIYSYLTSGLLVPEWLLAGSFIKQTPSADDGKEILTGCLKMSRVDEAGWARDRAFRAFINDNANLRSQVPALLAHDFFISKNIQDHQNHIESLLALFRLCAEKDVFLRAAVNLLTRQLVFLPSAKNIRYYEDLLNRLKELCGVPFVQPLQRLLSDARPSAQKLQSSPKGAYQLSALPHGSWHTGNNEVPVPFKDFFNILHNQWTVSNQGKRLSWAPELCHALVNLNFSSKRSLKIQVPSPSFTIIMSAIKTFLFTIIMSAILLFC